MESVKRSTDIEKNDKSQLANVTKITAILGVIFGVILATSMFIINN